VNQQVGSKAIDPAKRSSLSHAGGSDIEPTQSQVGDEGSSEEDLMVELRVGVDDLTRAPGLMRRLSPLFGRSAISFDWWRNEVRVESEWESRAVVEFLEAVEAWIDEGGGKRATLSIADRDAIPLS
jgi:hypothetical protein